MQQAKRRERARARWSQAAAWVKGRVAQAAARRAGEGRSARTGARTSTLVATVSSLDRAQAPATRRPQQPARATRPRLHLAAAFGPVLVDTLVGYEAYAALGDG